MTKLGRIMPNLNQKSPVTFSEEKIDAIFATLDQCRRPGAAVGIGIAGKTVYRKGFGLANMNLPVVLSPTMRIRIGSVSKHFVAFGYMLLCEDGRASIDDPVGKYLPELNSVTHKVTMRQLMGNNSCLRDAVDICQQFSGTERGRVTTSDLMSIYRESAETNFAPGTTNIYNNGGWIILSEVIERIAERSLERFLWERVFEPVGMHDTFLRQWDAEHVPNSADCHGLNVAGRFERTELLGGLDIAAAGMVASTADDMLRWLAHMDAPTIGTAKTWELMKTPQILSGVSTDYGLGLSIEWRRGVQMIHHSGGGYGSTTQMIKVPDAGLDVIVMCNHQVMCNPLGGFGSNAVGLSERILEACLPSLELEEPRYEGPFPEGVFRSPRTGRAAQFLRKEISYLGNEKVAAVALDGHWLAFTSDSKGVLRACGGELPGVTFTPVGSMDNPSSLRLNDLGIHDELVRVSITVDAKAAIASIVGRYRSDETGADALIVDTDAGPRLRTIGRFGSTEHSLEHLADGVWRNRILNRWVLPVNGFLLFDTADGSFGFYTNLTRNVRFRRLS